MAIDIANYAVSNEGKASEASSIQMLDYSLSFIGDIEIDYLVEGQWFFDPAANLDRVLTDISSSKPYSDSLLYAAAQAQQRIHERTGEAPEEWADRMASLLFDDLDES